MLDKRECEEIEMALRHKLKFHVFNELKCGIGYGEYWKHVKGHSSMLFFKFRSGARGLFEELDRHTKEGGFPECPDCGACKVFVEHVLFDCTSYDSRG